MLQSEDTGWQNGLKRNKQTKKNQDPSICCPKEPDTLRLKVKGWKGIYHASGSDKRAKAQCQRKYAKPVFNL